ncbi:Transcription initiation factor TFIID subunit 12 [Coemansia nantahalensis]|uniref:Transcription initiation factor TFIID subunit 12 n=1 Tax=Coemansia nantahalensis TaxID=2789366 RepID=A0ACC1JZ46_9FUNG|nr:Transcription initiation factor TFIID subunit 12 [Coemansia nantahalensis]
MADGSGSPHSLALPSQGSPSGSGSPPGGAEKGKGKGKDAGPRPKPKDAGRESGIVLSPAMVQQMRGIIENHAALKREADNNVPFTNHMLDLLPVPAEFQAHPIENTTQASAYINAENAKIRAHLAVVQQVMEGVTDADAKRRLGREAGLLDAHVKQVKNFMRLSFQAALSGNPAAGSFSKDQAALLRPPANVRPVGIPATGTAAAATPATGSASLAVSVSAAAAASTTGSPAVTPLSPYVVGARQRSGTVTPAANTNSTPVALSSALAHVATQSTRQSGPVDLDGGSRILSKRKIQELVSEIDPTERLEPEVEDILCDIADEFIESVTSFACQLAKHRKSDTLEAKDLQLHLERNWNIRIPGFSAEEIRSVRKTAVSQAHQERLNAITNTRNLRKFE